MAARNPTDMGENRTGMATSPKLGEKMIQGALEGVPSSSDDELDISRLRAHYIGHGDIIGSMPPPPTLKGKAKAAVKKMEGDDPAALLDKLGERLAFERMGSRLYEAFIGKVKALAEESSAAALEQLGDIHADEVRHYELVKRAIEDLGADPTVQTPSADVAGVASMGLMQVLTDPRTTIGQCLNALLIAELADNDGWRMLIDLATALGQEEMAEAFAAALQEEDEHLEQVRAWISSRMLEEAT